MQIRIWLYTPVLHSATSIMANPAQAQRVVDLARDTIQYLHHINTTTNLYRRIQVFYHQFLMSAISAVFLASVHAPVRFSDVCRHEFYMALDLVSELSAKSWVSQRLWRAIRSLKDVAPRFGLNPEDDAHSTAALGMIGLARGGHLDPSSAANTAAPGAQQPQPHGGVPRPGPAADPTRQPSQSAEPPTALDQNGAMLQTEMSRIFEGYVGLNGVQTMVDADGSDGSVRPGTESEMGNSPMYGPQTGTIYTQFKELL